jgi:hypothetical protein
MPVSNFHRVLQVHNDGWELHAAGPVDPPDPDSVSMRVCAVVTQEPLSRKPSPKDNNVPPAVTCNVDDELTKEEWVAAAAVGGPGWTFKAPTIGGQFREGWARGTAFALETKLNGDIETYSWSAWVWLERNP